MGEEPKYLNPRKGRTKTYNLIYVFNLGFNKILRLDIVCEVVFTKIFRNRFLVLRKM